MKPRHQSKLGNRNKLSLILSLGLLLLVGCKDAPLDSDPDYPYYTISGRVFEGYGEAPLANAKIQLEYLDEGSNFLEGSEGGKLKSVKTDEDGYFTLDYQGFTGSPPDRALDGMYLYADGRLILEAFPWNKSFERDFAEISHSRMVLQIEDQRSVRVQDTLFFGGGLMNAASYADEELDIIDFVDVDGLHQNAFVVYPIRDTVITTNFRSGSTYDHTPFLSKMAFATKTDWFKNPEKVIIVDAAWRGFPYSDTVSVTLTD